MDQQDLNDLCEVTGYTLGKLPVKYLGVPITLRKLTSTDCEMLLDKMGIRIQTWGSNNLSYAGRTQLVNSVHVHMHSYWASMFLLPRQVMK